MPEITDEMVTYIRTMLSKEGIRFFTKVKENHRRVNATISTRAAKAYHKGENVPEREPFARGPRPFPHPIHFREGMWIRNRLRDSGLCRDWSDHDLDNNWAEIVEKAIATPFTLLLGKENDDDNNS